MSLQISSEIRIEASAQEVWKQFTHWKQHQNWNPLLKGFKGEVKKGNKIVVSVDGMKFKPLITEYEEAKKLSWLGHLWRPGILDGQHSFEIIPIGASACIFKQSESFKGWILPLFKKKLAQELPLKFQKMNEALKAVCHACIEQ